MQAKSNNNLRENERRAIETWMAAKKLTPYLSFGFTVAALVTAHYLSGALGTTLSVIGFLSVWRNWKWRQ